MPVHVFFIIRPSFFLQIYSPIRLKIIYKHCIAAQYPCIFIVLLGFSLISRILVLSSVPLYIYSPIRPQTRALVSDHCPHPQAAESALSYKVICIYSNQYQYSFSL